MRDAPDRSRVDGVTPAERRLLLKAVYCLLVLWTSSGHQPVPLTDVWSADNDDDRHSCLLVLTRHTSPLSQLNTFPYS